MGSEVFVHFNVGGKAVLGEDVEAAVGEDAAEVARTAQQKGSVWVARVDRDTRAEEQKSVELLVDTARLHFFDPETGDAIYSD
jgi:multiple sugar transport system ATP-binding protein